MRLAHLDQRLALGWGDAQLLAYAIEWVLCGQLELEEPARTSGTLALGFGPLYRVRARLLARARQERHHQGPLPKKPWRLTVRYDEVVALVRILPSAPAAGRAWEQVQQASLRLERYIDFTQ